MRAAKSKGGEKDKKRLKDPSAMQTGAGGYGFLSSLKEEEEADAMEEQALEEAAAEMEALEGLSGSDVGEAELEEELSEEELARRGERQVTYTLLPSRKYVRYIAVQNAIRAWTKDGPDGVNRGCFEVQIAVLTEHIRGMVLHCRENIHDFSCRQKLIMAVAKRRKYLDKLSWTDVDAYLKIRDALKIRHVYRMEALIGRLPAYKYADENRKEAPGRKVRMRLKKSQKLLQRRLANQLRQGKPRKIVRATQSRVNARRWRTMPNEESNALLRGIPMPDKIDPLNIP